MIATGMRRLAAVLGPALVVVGLIGVAFGVGQVLDATNDPPGAVAVPMRLHSSDGRGAWLELEVDVELYDAVWVSGVPTDNRPDRDDWTDPLGVVVVHARDATLAEQLLSRADVLLRGIALLVAAIALLPVLHSVADGRPFQPGHERRLQVVAASVVLGAYVGPLLPWRASASVLARLVDVYGMSAEPPHHLEAFVVAALVLVVGAVLRAGTPDPPQVPSPEVPDLGAGSGGRRRDTSRRRHSSVAAGPARCSCSDVAREPATSTPGAPPQHQQRDGGGLAHPGRAGGVVLRRPDLARADHHRILA